jgi:Zn/Cd-binding protein ZinT
MVWKMDEDLDNVYELRFNEAMNKVKRVNKFLEALYTVGDKSDAKELDYKLEQLIRSHCKSKNIPLTNLIETHYQAEYETIETNGQLIESFENSNPYSALYLYNRDPSEEKYLNAAIENGGLEVIFKSMDFIDYNSRAIVSMIHHMEELCKNRTIADLIFHDWNKYKILLKGYIISENMDKFNKIKDEMKKLGIDTLLITGDVIKYDKNNLEQVLLMSRSSMDVRDNKTMKISYDCLMECINNNRIHRGMVDNLRITLMRFHEYGYSSYGNRMEYVDLLSEINKLIESRLE